jgi:excisionase family DNA binding protein
MNQIILSQIPVSELVSLISNEIKKQLPESHSNRESKNEEPETYYTRNEVCKLFHISLVTLNKHTKSKRLNAHRIGARVLYKRSEILNALSSFK